jgi:ABC-type Fe3+-siderophore transport system permease subunit
MELLVNVRRIRVETMLVISLLAAVPVSFVGTIGFIGLVGPHIARMILSEDQRFFLPGSVLSGALPLSVTSIVSKSIISGAVFPLKGPGKVLVEGKSRDAISYMPLEDINQHTRKPRLGW